MSDPVRETRAMIAQMAPERVPGRFVFRALPLDAPVPAAARASFREAEGLSAILPARGDEADAMAQITLGVTSALDGVGLTAAVSGALAGAGIPCNVVAACRHDHLFVPEAEAERALAVLAELAAQA